MQRLHTNLISCSPAVSSLLSTLLLLGGEFRGRMVQKCPGLRADGTPYAGIIRRRCRCLDCGQVRIDKEYAQRPRSSGRGERH